MDKKYFQDKKAELQKKFTQVVQQLEQLVALREQLKGQFALIEEMSEEMLKEQEGLEKPKVDKK